MKLYRVSSEVTLDNGKEAVKWVGTQSGVVAIKKDSTTYLGSAKLDNQAELGPQVKERLQDLPEGARIIYLKADDGLPYSEVMKVMDIVREAGVEEVALISERKVQG